MRRDLEKSNAEAGGKLASFRIADMIRADAGPVEPACGFEPWPPGRESLLPNAKSIGCLALAALLATSLSAFAQGAPESKSAWTRTKDSPHHAAPSVGAAGSPATRLHHHHGHIAGGAAHRSSGRYAAPVGVPPIGWTAPEAPVNTVPPGQPHAICGAGPYPSCN